MVVYLQSGHKTWVAQITASMCSFVQRLKDEFNKRGFVLSCRDGAYIGVSGSTDGKEFFFKHSV
jgi:hypothetical protein